ncbi:caspase, EACC1-associated type [Streptomyces sp. CA-250714]|uniref:caspase family protein n=1 Tax=Streptomyces sp. CA-250714 TaxID=3240060 RepID=UPI003D8B39FA
MEAGLNGLPDPTRSRAVVIGAAEYDVLHSLPSVTNNVDRLTELLRGPDGWGLSDDDCVPLLDSSREDVFEAVSAAATAADDALLVYYAGHGLLDGEDGLHLALRTSHAGELYRAVEYAPLRKMILNSRAQHRVVILDCCYSGSAAGRHLNASDGIADHAAIEGTYLMTATARTRMALAPEGETYTAFTGELVKVLEEGIPEGPRLLDLDTVFHRVWRELKAKDRPEPEQRSRNTGHLLVLARNRWNPAPTQEALRYAAALREVFGQRRDGVAEDSATVERYLSGAWIAPREFLEEICPEGSAEADRLHALRREAQKTAADTETQLAYAQEEGERLRSEVEQLRTETAQLRAEALTEESSAQRCAELSEKLTALTQQLAEERQRAEHLDRAWHELQQSDAAKQRQLEHAGVYVRELEAELTGLRQAQDRDQKAIRRLSHEVKVLQRQLRLHAKEESAEAQEDVGLGRSVRTQAEQRASHESEETGEAGDATGPTGVKVQNPDSTAAPAPKPGGVAVGSATVLAIIFGILYFGWALVADAENEGLTFSSGREPVTANNSTSRVSIYDHAWDVAETMDSTFRPVGGVLGDPDLSGVTSGLEVTVPEGCSDRTVRWQLKVDGKRAKSGVLHGKRKYEIDASIPLTQRPKAVTLQADWNGRSSSCPSFGLKWLDPELDVSFDPLFPF